MGSEDQALTVHSKKTRRSSHHPRGKHSHKDNTRKYLSRIRCYTCDEKGHYAREWGLETKMSLTRRRETREDIMLMLQRMMNLPQREPDMKVKTLQVMKNMF